MDSKHTPTPWTMGDRQEHPSLTINGPLGWGRVAYIAPAPAESRHEQGQIEKANAELIVEAVNAHAEIKEAFLRYAKHNPGCAYTETAGCCPCTCGLDETRRRLWGGAPLLVGDDAI